MPRQCPICGGTELTSVDPESAITFSCDRKCEVCGTVWRPAWPRYGAVLAIIAGCVAAGLAAFSVYAFATETTSGWRASGRRRTLAFVLGLGATGIAFVCVGVGVLMGVAGKQKILKTGEAPPASKPQSGPRRRPGA